MPSVPQPTHTHTSSHRQEKDKDVPLMWGYLQLRLMSTAESSAYSILSHTRTQRCTHFRLPISTCLHDTHD